MKPTTPVPNPGLATSDPPSETLSARERSTDWKRLLEVTSVLAREVDLDTVLSTVAHEACRALDCDRASLYRYDAKREELYTFLATELEIGEIRHRLDHGISGYVARERMIANVPDPPADPRWNSEVDQKTGYQTRNILAAPLASPRDHSLLGVIELVNKNLGSFDEQDEQLLEALAQHAAVALDRAALVDELRQRDNLDASLRVARDIQRGFMPASLAQPPGYEAASWWYPNEAVGGDYCDVIPLGDGRLGLTIADVSGHGLGPSLLMASVRAALKALVLEHSAPAALLGLLGQALRDDLQEGRFITMILAALDVARHRLEFANAGHAPAEFYVAATDEFISLESTGMPLGVLDQPDFPEGPARHIERGDLILFCTDGVVEAPGADDEPFGLNRLKRLVRQGHAQGASALVQMIGREIERHYVGDAPPDDLTILAVRRLP